MAFLETPRQYYEEFVVPNYSDYEKDPANPRLGLNSVMSCWHLSDWVWKDKVSYWEPITRDLQGRDEWTRFKNYLIDLNPDLNILRSLANGTKHFKRGFMDAVASAAATRIFMPGEKSDAEHGRPTISLSPLLWTVVMPDHVVVKVNGARVELRPMLQSVVLWWPTFLDQHSF